MSNAMINAFKEDGLIDVVAHYDHVGYIIQEAFNVHTKSGNKKNINVNIRIYNDSVRMSFKTEEDEVK